MTHPDPAHPGAPEVSVVMPAHNEEALLEQSVGDVAEELRRRGLRFEIVVSENGSGDGTLALAHRLAAADPRVRVLTRPGADYGAAMRAGILSASGDHVVVFDVDYYDGDFVDRVLPLLRAADGPAIVVGSKRAAGTSDTRPWARRMITAGFTTVLRVGFGLGVSDTHGMKAMRRAEVVAVAEHCRFGTDLFDTELVLRAERAGLRVGEVPVTVEERRPSRTPIARRILRTLGGLVRLRVVLWREERGARRHRTVAGAESHGSERSGAGL
jgi:glycosyltransferase involved in cell wall biosynthesis